MNKIPSPFKSPKGEYMVAGEASNKPQGHRVSRDRGGVKVNEQPAGNEGQSTPMEASGVRLQVLATEHWSLLATRSLTYSESFSRVDMFLSVLSGAVVSLALLAQVNHFDEAFTIAAVLILSVVLFVGLVTIGRLLALNQEDLRWVMGMNRLRHAYLEMYPELEPYFLTGSHDDLRGVLLTTDMDMVPGGWRLYDAAHGFQTLPAMLGVIVAVVAGVLGALIARWLGAAIVVTLIVAVITFLVTVVLLGFLTRYAFVTFARTMQARFPSVEPPKEMTQ